MESVTDTNVESATETNVESATDTNAESATDTNVDKHKQQDVAEKVSRWFARGTHYIQITQPYTDDTHNVGIGALVESLLKKPGMNNGSVLAGRLLVLLRIKYMRMMVKTCHENMTGDDDTVETSTTRSAYIPNVLKTLESMESSFVRGDIALLELDPQAMLNVRNSSTDMKQALLSHVDMMIARLFVMMYPQGAFIFSMGLYTVHESVWVDLAYHVATRLITSQTTPSLVVPSRILVVADPTFKTPVSRLMMPCRVVPCMPRSSEQTSKIRFTSYLVLCLTVSMLAPMCWVEVSDADVEATRADTWARQHTRITRVLIDQCVDHCLDGAPPFCATIIDMLTAANNHTINNPLYSVIEQTRLPGTAHVKFLPNGNYVGV